MSDERKDDSQNKSQDLGDAFRGFSKLDLSQRLARLLQVGALDEKDVAFLKQGGLKDTSLGEKFVENVIGYFQLPLGVATNFRINGRDVVIPMAVEETSIIAAASKTAKWVRESGSITATVQGHQIIGQIQISKIKDFSGFSRIMAEKKQFLIEAANKEVAQGLVRRGGGVEDFEIRALARPDGGLMAVVHVYMDAVDAMGANIINQVC